MWGDGLVENVIGEGLAENVRLPSYREEGGLKLLRKRHMIFELSLNRIIEDETS